MVRVYSIAFVAILGLTAGCPTQPGNGNDNGNSDGTTSFVATLDGVQEAPPTPTEGTGQGTFTLNAEQTELSYDITASGLTGLVTAAHFHRAPRGTAGDIVFPITDRVTENEGQVTIMGVWPELTAANVADLLAGNLYVNLHTQQNPAGEIRGQVEQE